VAGRRHGLAVFVAAAIIPVAFIMRRQPEEHGLLPDSDRTNIKSSGPAEHSSNNNDRPLILGNAHRTRVF